MQYNNIKWFAAAGALLGGGLPVNLQAQNNIKKPNILLITADDLNWDSIGAFGCPVEGTSPNIDKLAKEGIRFQKAHVSVAVSQPCRASLLTGLYPQNNGVQGFTLSDRRLTTLPESLRKAGYLTACFGKLHHSIPNGERMWEKKWKDDFLRGRDAAAHARAVSEIVEQARKDKRPFFFMINSHDPHRPFHGSRGEAAKFRGKKIPQPSRVFKPEEVAVPGFLPDLKDVRKELAQYYSSVRRLDDTVGAILQALKKSGAEENTLVVFMSDHGMALPFAKTNCYNFSTRTPLIARWPGTIKPDTEDERHFVSGVDLMPTLLEIADVPAEKSDGRSFAKLLKGKKQRAREAVFTQFHETSRSVRYPMRAIQTEDYIYIYNPWVLCDFRLVNGGTGGLTFPAMCKAAKHDELIRERVEFHNHRILEELYSVKNDPDALNNLIDDPAFADDLKKLQKKLYREMKRTHDPALFSFVHRQDKDRIREFLDKEQEEANRKSPKKAGIRKRLRKRRGV